MKTIEYKGRKRLDRGVLKRFEDLPEEHQSKYILIKSFICEYFPDCSDVYVGGSFLWGWWDEYSDYDIELSFDVFKEQDQQQRFDTCEKIKKIIYDQHAINMDIVICGRVRGVLIASSIRAQTT